MGSGGAIILRSLAKIGPKYLKLSKISRFQKIEKLLNHCLTSNEAASLRVGQQPVCCLLTHRLSLSLTVIHGMSHEQNLACYLFFCIRILPLQLQLAQLHLRVKHSWFGEVGGIFKIKYQYGQDYISLSLTNNIQNSKSVWLKTLDL